MESALSYNILSEILKGRGLDVTSQGEEYMKLRMTLTLHPQDNVNAIISSDIELFKIKEGRYMTKCDPANPLSPYIAEALEGIEDIQIG